MQIYYEVCSWMETREIGIFVIFESFWKLSDVEADKSYD